MLIFTKERNQELNMKLCDFFIFFFGDAKYMSYILFSSFTKHCKRRLTLSCYMWKDLYRKNLYCKSQCKIPMC